MHPGCSTTGGRRVDDPDRILGGRRPAASGPSCAREAAIARFGIDDLHITVIADAAHKPAEAASADRLAMARLAFAGLDATVELEEHRYTVDALEAAGYDDPIFLIGADELVDFPTWKRSRSESSSWRGSGSPRARVTRRRPPRRASSSSSSSRSRFPPPRSASASAPASRSTRSCCRRSPATSPNTGLPRRLTSGFPGYTESSDFARTSTPDRRSREREAGRRSSSST